MLGGMGEGIWGYWRGLAQRNVVFGRAVEDEAALEGVGGERDVGLGRCAGWRVEMQNECMREGSRED